MAENPKENRPSEVIYQVYPSSFCDASGDGHGDLKGITGKLDYIKGLDVDAIWISPFFLSPPGGDGDGGYAITDYRKIDPRFGTTQDFEHLLDEAHKRGLRVYTDFVLCHTASNHDWFEKSRNREPGFENRYVWHDGKIEGDRRAPPNNWKSCFTNGPAWTFDDKRQQYYLHHFNTSQPALNLNDAGVQDAVLAEMKFWLDKGVDGLRLDALPFANHDPKLKDNSWRGEWPNDESRERWDMQRFDHSMCQPQTVQLVAKIRRLLDSYPTKKTALGEVIAGREGGTQSSEVAAEYIDRKTGLDTCYTESLIKFWEYPSAGALKEMLKESVALAPDGGFCTNASNHDFPRAATRMTEKAPEELRSTITRQLMSLYVSLPGSLCLYQGEELGLPQARIPEDIPHDKKKDLVDKRCRDGARTPMPWDSDQKHAGFSTSDDPYLPVAGSHYARAVNLQENEPDSMLQFTRHLLKERKENPALNRGKTIVLDTPEPILAFVRKSEDQTILLAYNISQRAVTFKPADYLDAETLKALHIPHWSEVRIHAYGYSRHGLHSHLHEKNGANGHAAETKDTGDGKGKSVFAADMVITDNLFPDDKAAAILAGHKIAPNHRSIIDRAAHQRLLADAPKPDLTLGGSTAITLWTLKKLLGDEVNVNFMGLPCDDACGAVAKAALKEAGVNLLTETWPEGVKPEATISHVIRSSPGQHAILTYPGTGAEGLKKLLAQPKYASLLEDSIRKSDIVYLQGSLTQKFGQTFTDEVLRLRWKHNKELVLSLPTHASFGPNDNQTFKRLIPSANVVTGNDVEFCRLYDMKTDRPVSDAQLRKVTDGIQEAFRSNVLEDNGHPGSKEQVAFITRGDKPSLLVTADMVIEVPAAGITARKNALGAGDAATAGFLAGYIKGLDHEQSATLSMSLAAEKVEQDNLNPSLADPHASLDKVFLRKSLSRIAAAYNGAGVPSAAVSGRF